VKALRWWMPFAVLLALALAAGLAVGPDASDSLVPSAENPGPRGLKVLATWLRETGVDVRVGTEPLTALPPDVRTVLLPAPTTQELSEDEVTALQRFVEGGGVLVALLPRSAGQLKLKRWLRASLGDVAPLDDVPGVKDLGGSTARVKIPGGPLTSARALRISAEAMVELDDETAVPVTEPPALWWKPLGAGALWVAAGPELAENARLELLDNAAFWAGLGARGPLWIDEGHHHRPEGGPPPLHLLATALQGALVALLFVATFGARLGPPREEPEPVHRTTSEYVTAMAALTQRARVERELVEALRAKLRRRLHDELGLPLSLSWDELARLTAQRSRVSEHMVLTASTTGDFLALSRLVAQIDAELGVDG
jgi:hypothetical protein